MHSKKWDESRVDCAASLLTLQSWSDKAQLKTYLLRWKSQQLTIRSQVNINLVLSIETFRPNIEVNSTPLM
jgi:hypothetical protein